MSDSRFENEFAKTIVDPGRGKHLWTMLAMFLVTDPAGSTPSSILEDEKNLLDAYGPGCHKCKSPYDESIARRYCPGVFLEWAP